MSSADTSPYAITLDDDPVIHRIIGQFIGQTVLPFRTASGLRKQLDRLQPVAAFIDIHLEDGENGLDLIPLLVKAWPYVPIIVITATLDGQLVGQALATGAHDFMTKPLNPDETKARFQTRRAEMKSRLNHAGLPIGNLIFDRQLGKIHSHSGDSTALSPQTAALLALLIEADGETVAKDSIHRRLWPDAKVSNNALDQRVAELKRALAAVNASVDIQRRYGKGIALQPAAARDPA